MQGVSLHMSFSSAQMANESICPPPFLLLLSPHKRPLEKHDITVKWVHTGFNVQLNHSTMFTTSTELSNQKREGESIASSGCCCRNNQGLHRSSSVHLGGLSDFELAVLVPDRVDDFRNW